MSPGRCLIVANQTLGGDALDQAVRDCIDRDVSSFYVVVPLIRLEHERVDWRGGFSLGEDATSPDRAAAAVAAIKEREREREAAQAEARRRAHQRLERMVAAIQALGGDAQGEVGAADPLEATRAALRGKPPFDEVIVSTLPSGISRWLRMDLPNRVARMTGVRVNTVEAEAS